MSHYIDSFCSKHGEYCYDVDNAHGCPECFTLSEALEYLYSHEINCFVRSFWDGGFEVGIGDDLNGVKDEKQFSRADLWEAGNWLVEAGKRIYPDCQWRKP